MSEVEQVGFVSDKLLMMGNELCINAQLAYASLCNNKEGKISIELKLDYRKEGNIILFEGIGFLCENIKPSEDLLKKLADKYNLPAFGIINYNKNKIIPYVYVREMDSFVKETACGSGSLAFSILFGYKNILQPTGEIINIKIKKDKVLVTAEIRRVK